MSDREKIETEAIPAPPPGHEATVEHSYPAYHAWKQVGNELICTSCQARHGVTLPIGVYLVDIAPDGQPMFERQA